MTLLALDLGSSCGFAIFKNGEYITETKKLQTTYKEKFGARFLEFRNWLLDVIEKHQIQSVYFERVFGHLGTEAAHCFGGFMYTLASVCLQKNIPCTGFTVQAIKKFMTGKGNATKEEIIAVAKSKGFDPKTDDEADAIAIMLLALECLNNKDYEANKSKNRFFLRLTKSGCQAPDNSLASEFLRGLTPSSHCRPKDLKKKI